jgi:prepilin-type N-terminal cleavage/methylation domain-containing protein
MNTKGFSVLEILIALVLLSSFMMTSFQILEHFNLLEKSIHADYAAMNLLA